MGRNNCSHISCSFVRDFYLLAVENTVEWRISWEMLPQKANKLATNVGPHIAAPGWVEPYDISAFSFTTAVGVCSCMYFLHEFQLVSVACFFNSSLILV